MKPIYTITLPGSPALYNPTPLPGWETVGEISCLAEVIAGQPIYRRGALVKATATGMYACACAGVITVLDQREVGYALAATAGVDIDGEKELTAAEAAPLVGQTIEAIRYWSKREYIKPVNPGGHPAKYRKADVLAAAGRPAGRPRKK